MPHMKAMKLLFAALAAVTMTFTAQAAKTAKVVVEDGDKTLRFVYDERDYGTKGTHWFSVTEAEAIDPPGYPPWNGLGNDVTEVIFDDSFAGYRPKHCSRWFYGFRWLSIIQNIGNLNTSEAKSFVYMFASCWALKSLDTSGFDTAKVTDMGYMFANCSSLTTLDVSGFDTANVTTMYGMFDGCSSLTALDLSCFDTSKVENMEYMFRGCSSLQTIAVSDAFVTTAVMDSDDMFLDCKALVGDAKSLFIAAASILAKTARDADCLRLERLYPGYGIARHKGYPTAEHYAALAKLGPCPEHRRSFRLSR